MLKKTGIGMSVFVIVGISLTLVFAGQTAFTQAETTITTDKTSYLEGETIKITGMIDNHNSSSPYVIIVIYKGIFTANEEWTEATINPDGSFSAEFNTVGWNTNNGTHIVSVGNDDYPTITTEFEFILVYHITTDKASYTLGDTIKITGTMPPPEPHDFIKNLNGEIVNPLSDVNRYLVWIDIEGPYFLINTECQNFDHGNLIKYFNLDGFLVSKQSGNGERGEPCLFEYDTDSGDFSYNTIVNGSWVVGNYDASIEYYWVNNDHEFRHSEKTKFTIESQT